MEQDRLFVEAALVEGTADRQKREVVLDLIAEGFGNRRDNHYYGPHVLESHVKDFEGAKMYVDHLDPEAQRKLNGMPRSVKDLGGRIVETEIARNDENKVVVRGRAKIAQPWLWELIENDPGLLGVSINAWGKAKAGTVEGRQARIVEGISKVGSVDWVTEAGAGGKVVSLVEAQLEQEEEESEVALSDLTAEQLKEERPDLVEEIMDSLSEEEAEQDQDETQDEESDEDAETSGSDDEADEAQESEADEQSDEDEDVCAECGQQYDLEADIEARAEELAESQLTEAVKAALEVAQERFQEALEEEQADSERKLAQVNQRIKAAQIIEQAGFKPPTERALKEQFLDAYFEAEFDDKGNETKSADKVLADAVQNAIEEKRSELSAYTEARVTGAGETGATGGKLNGGGDTSRLAESAPIDESIDEYLFLNSGDADEDKG